MFIEYLQNTLLLLLSTFLLLAFFPKLKEFLKKKLAKIIISSYFSDGLWLRKKDQLNSAEDELVHLMFIDSELVITKIHPTSKVSSVDSYGLSEAPFSPPTSSKKIILPNSVN